MWVGLGRIPGVHRDDNKNGHYSHKSSCSQTHTHRSSVAQMVVSWMTAPPWPPGGIASTVSNRVFRLLWFQMSEQNVISIWDSVREGHRNGAAGGGIGAMGAQRRRIRGSAGWSSPPSSRETAQFGRSADVRRVSCMSADASPDRRQRRTIHSPSASLPHLATLQHQALPQQGQGRELLLMVTMSSLQDFNRKCSVWIN